MPRKTRLKKRTNLSEEQAKHLEAGAILIGDPRWPNMRYPFKDENHRRELWLKNRARFVEFAEMDDFFGSFILKRKPGDIPPQSFFLYEVPDAPKILIEWNERNEAWKLLSEKEKLAWHKRFIESEPPKIGPADNSGGEKEGR
jgi:hypothetical protein